MTIPFTPIAITWTGKPAQQLTGWQAAPDGNPKKATTVIRVNGRRRVAFAADVRTA
jgi:hypothetical protein